MIRKNEYVYYLIIVFSIITANYVIWQFTGLWPSKQIAYNSYYLQAQAWLQGRMDLGRNYKHLEIAEYAGKFYISFPPLPSVLLLPFVLLFKGLPVEGYLAIVSASLSGVYAYKICRNYKISAEHAIFWVLFLCIGSNYLFLMVCGWVWFFAQNLSFMFTTMAIYYACSDNKEKYQDMLSFLCLAFAVGCRPFQAIYMPLLLYLAIKRYKETTFIKHLFISVLPAFFVGILYMLYNYARFHDFFEFGHNYLPEFLNYEHGQFNIVYLANNLKSLFLLPEMGDVYKYPKFNGFAFFIASPIYLSYFVYFALNLIFQKRKLDKLVIFSIPLLICIHLFTLCLHATMGGLQFGNRYTVDTLPIVFFGLVFLLQNDRKFYKYNIPIFIFGINLNLIGSILIYNNLI